MRVSAGRQRLRGTRSEATAARRETQDANNSQQKRERALQRLQHAEREYEEAEKELSELVKDDSDVSFANYGFISAGVGTYMERSSSTSTTPPNFLRLAVANFQRELDALLRWLRDRPSVVRFEGEERPIALGQEVSNEQAKEAERLRQELDRLTLSNEKVWQRERSRPPVNSPLVIRIPYYVLCWALDVVFDRRPIQRFWFLETVARMPYFSYLSMLHLYESLGWWRIGADMKRVHFAEEHNEYHHLLIMESLGGDRQWSDRFLAQHAAVVYYWVLIVLWMLSPAWAYNFSELVESHAVDTYAEFCDENESLLKRLPAPRAAQLYYAPPSMYFDEFQTEQPKGSRRPSANTLYDVFCNVRDDEREHVKTMSACQQGSTPVLEVSKVTQVLVALASIGIVTSVAIGAMRLLQSHV